MKTLVASILLLALTLSTAHAQSDELLEPRKAFAFSAQATSPEQVAFTWDIADGYYMYRDKFNVRVIDGNVAVGDLVMPPGKTKTDEFFGEQVIYTGEVIIHAPIERNGNRKAQTLLVEVTGQGCNEPIGVCYPPLKQTATLHLAALTEENTSGPQSSNLLTTQQSAEIDSLASLKELLDGDQNQQEFLHPDEAFRFDLYTTNPDRLEARFVIADGYYLYRDKLDFQSQTEGIHLEAYELPPGVEKVDEYFGRTETYIEGFEVLLPLQRESNNANKGEFLVTYQGCAEKGICYPPIKKTVTLDLMPIGTAYASPPGSGVGSEATVSQGFWGYVAGAFGVGLLLTFTPCVLPLIPIMSSFIVGESNNANRVRGGMLSLVYVLGTAVTYTAAGMVAGATGDQLQAYFQNVWFISFVSIILIVLALSMFGLYEIQMPSGIQSHLQQKTQRIAGGKLAMVFGLGIISALIVGACVSPLLIGALGVAIVKGDPILGGAIMFSMALGMGFFLVAIGFGLGAVLPKAGAWMDYIKYGFGVVLVGTAIYLLGTIPWVPVLYLWSVLFIVTAIYCGALQSLPQGAGGWRYLSKGVGVVLLVWGVLALLGGMSGNRDILHPVDIAGWNRDSTVSESAGIEFVRVNNLGDLDEQLKVARINQKPAMLDYYADWCVDCIRMEKATFNDSQVVEVLSEFVLLQVDVTDATNESTNAVKKKYGVYGPPAMLFFDRSGYELSGLRRYGFMSAPEFLAHIAEL